MQTLKAAHPDLVLQSSYTADAILSIKTYKELGFRPDMILANNAGFTDTDFVRTLGKDADYVITREVWALDLAARNPLIKQVNDLFYRRHQIDFTGNSSRTFTGLMVLADAIDRAGSTDPEAIRQALRATDMPGRQLIMPWKGVKFDASDQNTLGLVPEGRRLFPRLTGLRNLELGAYTCQDRHRVQAGMVDMFALFPILRERATQLAGTMSGGEQQMLAIARGLMAQPRLLLLDEPCWGIAPKLVTKVLDVIAQVNRSGVTILLVEQNLHKALGIADYAYVIQTGRIVLQGTGQELAADDRIKKAYLGL